MKYAVSNWIFGSEKLNDSVKRLTKFGYDGIEIVGEPDVYDVNDVTKILDDHGITCTSICGMFPSPFKKTGELRDLTHPDKNEREKAKDYLKRCIEFAGKLAAPVLITVINPVAKVKPLADVEDEFKWGCQSVAACADLAKEHNVILAIEPINRYEAYLVCSLDDALRVARTVNHPNVKIMADCFHMNIEEADPAASLRHAGDMVVNVHVADSNRQAAGKGHTDFKAILRALKDMNYQYTLTLEPMPPVADPYELISGNISKETLDELVSVSIDMLKMIEKVL